MTRHVTILVNNLINKLKLLGAADIWWILEGVSTRIRISECDHLWMVALYRIDCAAEVPQASHNLLFRSIPLLFFLGCREGLISWKSWDHEF